MAKLELNSIDVSTLAQEILLVSKKINVIDLRISI